jgi:hypothetical protein
MLDALEDSHAVRLATLQVHLQVRRRFRQQGHEFPRLQFLFQGADAAIVVADMLQQDPAPADGRRTSS